MAKKHKPIHEESSIEKNLDVADSALTKFGNILRKHWGKIILLLISYGIYLLLTMPPEVIPADPMQEQIEESVNTNDEAIMYEDTAYYEDSVIEE